MPKLIEPYAKISGTFNLSHGIDCLRKIEYHGRLSHRSEDRQTEDSWDKFLRNVVLDKGDWSIVEHASVTASFYVDRGISHEFVRHRLFAFTQESTRFVNYVKKQVPAFIYPRPQDADHDSDWVEAISFAEEKYQKLIGKGWSPQEARSVFPHALATRIDATCNLRNWRHFFMMRTTRETHPQFRQVSIPLLGEFQAKIPILFEDLRPMLPQKESLARAR